MKTYWVWWSFVNNHLKEVKKIEAESIEEAIKQSTWYDPRVVSPRGERMSFFVFQEVACAGSTSLVVVHTGPVKDDRTFMEHITGVKRE